MLREKKAFNMTPKALDFIIEVWWVYFIVQSHTARRKSMILGPHLKIGEMKSYQHLYKVGYNSFLSIVCLSIK